MQAIFGLTRERSNELISGNYKNVNGSTFHFHSQIEIILVQTGQTEVTIGNKTKILSPGELAIAVSFTPHIFRARGESLVRIAFIPTYLCEDFVSATKDKHVTNPFVSDGRATALISECFDALSDSEANNIEKMGYVNVILGTILRSLNLTEGKEVADTSFLSKLLLHLNDNFKTNLTIETIAHELGYSTGYVSRSFKRCFGVSINQYLTSLRLNHAINLLKDGDASITECALESGFNSIRTFYRAFESELGCSPKAYRKTIHT